MFINEETIEYDPCSIRKKVSVQLNEVYEKNLRPNFKLGRVNVGIFACIAEKSRRSLVLVRKKSKKKRTSPHDRLCLNSS